MSDANNEGGLGGEGYPYRYRVVVKTKTHAGLWLPGVHVTLYDENGDFVTQQDTGIDGVLQWDWYRNAQLSALGFCRVEMEKDGYAHAENWLDGTFFTPGQGDDLYGNLNARQILLDAP